MKNSLGERLRTFMVPKESFKTFRAEVEEYNFHALQVVGRIGLVLSTGLLLCSLLGVLRLMNAYLLLVAFFVLIVAVTWHPRPGARWILPLYYTLLIGLLSIGIVMGTVWGQDTNATTYLLFLLLLPLLMLDYPWRMGLIIACMSLLFCLAAVRFKTGVLLRVDLSNTIVFTLLTMFLAPVNVRRKMQAFQAQLIEVEAVREKDALINDIPMGIGIFEIQGRQLRQVYLNDSFFELLGSTRAGWQSHSAENLLDEVWEKDRSRVTDAVQRLVQGADQASATCRLCRADGSLLWVRIVSAVAQRRPERLLAYTAFVSMEEEMESRAALERSRAMLGAAAQSARMSVWELDCVRHSARQDEAARQQNGLEAEITDVPESLIRRGYYFPESVEPVRELYSRLYATCKTVQADFHVRLPNGTGSRWEHVILTPVFDRTGRMERAVGTTLDVTERKEKEEQYYHQIGLMSENSEKNLIAKAQYDLTAQKIIYYSTAREDAVELEKDEPFGTIVDKLVQAQTDEESIAQSRQIFHRERLLQSFAAGTVEGSLRYRRQMPGKATVYAITRYLMSADPQSGHVMLFVYCYDDTHHRIEQKIIAQISTRQYDALGVVDVATGSYALENGSERLRRLIPLTGPDYRQALRTLTEKLVVTEEQKPLLDLCKMEELCRRAGESTPAEFPCTIHCGNGELRRKKVQLQYLDDTRSTLLFTLSDITRLYRQEQEQLRLTRQALVEAKQATRAKTDFLSRMSHDIRTPLNAILGTAALALDETGDPAAIRESLETINTSGHFLLGLINDILDINKIESGKIELRPEPYELAEFVNAVETTIRPLMENKDIAFDFRMDGSFGCILADKLRFNQIFFNLLSNAAKYTPQGGHVTFSSTPLPAVAGVAGLRMVVRDDGIGMSQEYMSHLFEPFTRDSNAAINQTEGSGLGLAIVKNLVDTMGGTISATSRLGEGTEFAVDLFLPTARPVVHSVQPNTRDESLLDGSHILLVEDNAINVRIARRLLEKKGCIVTVATDGKQGMEAFAASPINGFDLILMDIRMPVMNGLDSTRAIRAMDRPDAAAVPILAMTADAFSEDIGKTREAGMNGHLPKPVEPEKLYTLLLQTLRRRAQIADPAEK